MSTLVCPNCTSKVEREKPLDLIVTCHKCGNEWRIVPKNSKLEYLTMILQMAEKSTKKEIAELGFDVNTLIKEIVEYEFYTLDIYYKIQKFTGKTIDELTESILVKPEEFEDYRDCYLSKNKIAKKKSEEIQAQTREETCYDN